MSLEAVFIKKGVSDGSGTLIFVQSFMLLDIVTSKVLAMD